MKNLFIPYVGQTAGSNQYIYNNNSNPQVDYTTYGANSGAVSTNTGTMMGNVYNVSLLSYDPPAGFDATTQSCLAEEGAVQGIQYRVTPEPGGRSAVKAPLLVFPNPANETLRVLDAAPTSADELILRSSLTGGIVLRHPLTESTPAVDVHHLPAGLYLAVLLKSGKHIGSTRVQISH